VLAKLYHLSHNPSLFALVIFQIKSRILPDQPSQTVTLRLTPPVSLGSQG
jgi:hypothetical protein